MRWNKAIYWSLGDVAALEDDTWYPNTSNSLNMSTIMTKYGLVLEDSSNDKITLFNQLMRIIYARFYECSVFKKLVSIFVDETQVTITASQLKYIWNQFVGMFNLTAPRFIPLLESYKANEENPIAKIKSTTTGINRFNDTPQNGGDFSDDEHTSTINQNKVDVEADSGSVVERLDSLYKNWRSILRDWSNEFRCLFYDGGEDL